MIVENDSAKCYRYGMEGYFNAVALTDANKGQRVIYENRMRTRILVTESKSPPNVIDLCNTPHDLNPDIYLKADERPGE